MPQVTRGRYSRCVRACAHCCGRTSLRVDTNGLSSRHVLTDGPVGNSRTTPDGRGTFVGLVATGYLCTAACPWTSAADRAPWWIGSSCNRMAGRCRTELLLLLAARPQRENTATINRATIKTSDHGGVTNLAEQNGIVVGCVAWPIIVLP
jgi:hypothetical protein